MKAVVPVRSALLLGLLLGLCLAGCQSKPSRGFLHAYPTTATATATATAEANNKEDTPPEKVNGLALLAWKANIAEACDFGLDGLQGTARTSDKEAHDWIWISVDGAALPDIGQGCFLRLTDDAGRVLDTEDAQNVELSLVKTTAKTSNAPLRAVVFRVPPRWSSTPNVTLELYSQRTLLNAWRVEGIDSQPAPAVNSSPATAKNEDCTFQARVVTEYSNRPSGALDTSSILELQLSDEADRDLRWVADLTKGADEPMVVVGRGATPLRIPIKNKLVPGDAWPFHAKFYAFTTRAAISYYVFASMRDNEQGQPQFRSGANVVVSLAGDAGRFVVPNLFSTGKPLPDGSFDFTFPCRWTRGKKSWVGEPLKVGGTVPAIQRSSRGSIVPTVVPGDTFTIRMTKDEVEYLKGGRFTFDMWVETRKLVAQAELDKSLTCEESKVWTQAAALTRSDDMTRAGE